MIESFLQSPSAQSVTFSLTLVTSLAAAAAVSTCVLENGCKLVPGLETREWDIMVSLSQDLPARPKPASPIQHQLLPFCQLLTNLTLPKDLFDYVGTYSISCQAGCIG